jgi:DNA-binding phage protein
MGVFLHQPPADEEDSVTEKLDRLAELLKSLPPDRVDLFWEQAMGKKKTAGPPTLSDQLKEAIALSGRTYGDIGKASGVSPGLISRFCTGKRSPTLDTAGKIAAALGLRLTEGGEQ